MKVGDLVTLSAYAAKLGGLYQWSAGCRARSNKPPLVGLIIKVDGERWTWDPKRFTVRWVDKDPPEGRDGRYGCVYFTRKDLRFVK